MKWGRYTCLVNYWLKKIVENRQLFLLLSVWEISLIGNEISDREFIGMPTRNFIPDWGHEIINQSDQLTNSSGNLYYCPKLRALLVSPKHFYQADGNTVRER